MANYFKIYASNLNYVYNNDASYESSTFRQSGGVPNNTASAFAVNTALYCASIVCKSLIDALITNTGLSSLNFGIDYANNLTTNIGSLLSGLNVAKAAQWTTARTFKIQDADATNTGATQSVNGTGDVTLKLPSTIKASLTGTASNAAKIGGKSFNMTYDSSTSTLNITYTD